MKDLLAESGPSATSGSFDEAVHACDVLLLATPWPATESLLESLGDLRDKVLIDATNPLKPDLSGLTDSGDMSGGEMVASWAKNARVVKAFNTVGFNVMANPHFDSGSAMMLYCGDDTVAKKVLIELAEDLGFEPADAGPLKQARVLEPLALLWISLALQYGWGRDFAFQTLRR